MPESEPRAVLDANVLANIHVCDLLFRLAEEPAMYEPLWSERILDEVQRTHAKLTWKPEISDHWRHEVQRAFPDSTVSGFEELENQVAVDPKDRHVAAAAAKAKAQWIRLGKVGSGGDSPFRVPHSAVCGQPFIGPQAT